MKAIRRLWGLAALIAVAAAFFCLDGSGRVFAGELTAETPSVVITGSAAAADEKAYSLNELKQIAENDTSPEKTADNQYLHSAINTWETCSVYRSEGVILSSVFQAAGLAGYEDLDIRVIAPDGYVTTFTASKTDANYNPTTAQQACTTRAFSVPRYYFPNFTASDEAAREEGKAEVPVIIAWARAGNKGTTTPPAGGEVAPFKNGRIMLVTGQLDPLDVNNPAWNGDSAGFEIAVGEDGPEVLTVTDADNDRQTSFRRAEILMMPRAVRNCGSREVRGVPAEILLKSFGDNTQIEVVQPGGKAAERIFTKQELAASGYVLAYEEKNADGTFTGLYDGDGKAVFELCGEDTQDGEALQVKAINAFTALPDVIAAASKELDEYLADADGGYSQYYPEQQQEIIAVINGAKEQMQASQSAQEVRAICAEAEAKLAAVRTAADLDAHDLSKAEVTLDRTRYTFAGSAVRPAVTVRLGYLTLKADTDYKVSYSANKTVGKARVTVTGAGEYWNTVSKSFTINPRKAVISKAAPGSRKLTVTYRSLPGGVSYQVGLRLAGGKWKNYTNGKKLKRIFTGLKSKKRYSVRVRAYKKAGTKTYYGSWSTVKTVKVR